MYIEENVREDSHPFTAVDYDHSLLLSGNMSGLVAAVNQDLLLLRWVFVDAKAPEIRYGTAVKVTRKERLLDCGSCSI